MPAMFSRNSRTARVIAAVTLVIVLITALVWLDLANEGLAWQALYSVTGEESPLSQVRGFIEWVGNVTRATPELALDAPVQYASWSPFGVNTFLEQEVESVKRQRQIDMIADAGFDWIRQQFVWEDIEIHARGDFTDRRNEPQGIDAWAKYDEIVAMAEAAGLDILARIGNPPAWSQTVAGDFAPPSDIQDFVNFAVRVAERYRGRIQTFQIWNEPNIYPEWGEQAVNPEAFAELLCRTYDALQAIDPNLIVVAPALSPTLALTQRDLNEFIYLERLYAAGAGRCFDVMAAQAYGFFSGPTDQRLRVFQPNFGRQQFVRDIMVSHGDGFKPIWLTEMGWNPIDSPEVPADVTNREGFGIVTREQAARYLTGAFDRALREFPYVNGVMVWFFRLPSTDLAGQSWYYFRMVEPDFTTLPVYDATREFIATYVPVLYRGVHQAEHWMITRDDASRTVDAPDAQFSQAQQITRAEWEIHGTGMVLRVQGEADVVIDGQPAAPDITFSDGGSWRELVFSFSTLPTRHEVVVQAEVPILFDSVQVTDHSPRWLTPLLLSLAAVSIYMLSVIGNALWQRFNA